MNTTAPETAGVRVRTRSPAYPAIGLKRAVDLCGKLWATLRKGEAHIDSALAAMGFARHGESLRIIAALRHYGLLDEVGAGDARRVKLSERAQDIIHLAEDDPRKRLALRAAALSPAIHAALWERYGRALPGESAIRPFLVRDKGFNESVISDVIGNYAESFEVANLGADEDDNVVENISDTGPLNQPPAQIPPIAAAIHSSNPSPQQSSYPCGLQELPILIGENRHARIPFPMTEDDFDLLIGTLNLWKKKIVVSKLQQGNTME